MLLVVGWSAVVVWLNVRPRVYDGVDDPREGSYHRPEYFVRYGFPWAIAYRLGRYEGSSFRILDYEYQPYYRPWPLAANIAIGLLAVAVLTFASKYLLRAIVAGLRAHLRKPPPSKEKGPERASEGL